VKELQDIPAGVARITGRHRPRAWCSGSGRSFSLEGARILASHLCDAAEAPQRRVVERAADSHAGPFDLCRLLSVPDRLLRLG